MLLIFDRAQSHVPLKILSIEDGSVLKAFNHLLHRNKKVDFIEQFNEKLLVKQENENLQILDVSCPDDGVGVCGSGRCGVCRGLCLERGW